MYYLIFGMLKDMVIKLRFEIYQSEGTVEYGPNEIILRPCSSESGQNQANQRVFGWSYCPYQTRTSGRYTLMKI
jgi:hypothetical protein